MGDFDLQLGLGRREIVVDGNVKDRTRCGESGKEIDRDFAVDAVVAFGIGSRA